MRKLPEVIDQLTDEERRQLLLWFAEYRPSQLRESMRHGPARVREVYREAGRPHG